MAYLSDLEEVIQFLEQPGVKEIRYIGLPHLESYLAEPDSRGLQDQHVNAKSSHPFVL